MPGTTDEIRELYLRFFEERGHLRLPSSSLVPAGDPTLLLTTAGMVQIKPYFTGEAVPPNPRLTSCQKCFRTTDIDSVGDDKHLTFFEMLGNFSVGDYFKKEAIAWAWEFITQKLSLPKERLWITVYLDDDEAHDFWRALGVPESRILRYGETDNFWGPAGDSGPCGPSSEIHYDWGEEYGCGPDCEPAHPCGRFLEIWNLVFTQFDQDRDRVRTPLPKPNIDTGMGLERAVSVVTGKQSFYSTEIFQPLLALASELTGARYGGDAKTDRALRTIVEHSRGIAFLLTDGVVPTNDGRGYVLRRLLRRAVRFGWLLDLKEPFLGKMAEAVIRQMGHTYPELARQREFILRMVEHEETGFQRTLEKGLGILEGYLEYLAGIPQDMLDKVEQDINSLVSWGATSLQFSIGDLQRWVEEASLTRRTGNLADRLEGGAHAYEVFNRATYKLCEVAGLQATPVTPGQAAPGYHPDVDAARRELEIVRRLSREIPGEKVFYLFDTYGFPAELTEEIALEHGLTVDMEGFRAEMERQRERARAAHKFTAGEEGKAYEDLGLDSTPFLGYETTEAPSSVVAILVDGEPVEAAEQGQVVEVILLETPFYAEMGGQVGDTGVLKGEYGLVQVTNTVHGNGLIVHRGKVVQGRLAVNDGVVASVDAERRADIMRNHTATHLLQAALRRVIGSHVRQTGSLVAPDRLRFDYSHLLAPSPEELAEIQRLANEYIRRNLPVQTQQVPYRQAVESGAIALFDEKYGELVRLVEVKAPSSGSGQVPEGRVSAELCGGTHCSATGQIGLFLITSEASVGSGMRRIEAVTGRGAEALVRERFSAVDAAARSLRAPVGEVAQRVNSLVEELDAARKRAAALERELARKALDLEHRVVKVDEAPVIAGHLPGSSMETLRTTGDWAKERLGSAVIVLASEANGRPQFMAMVTSDLVEKGYHAGEIVKRVAAITGGGGGGRPELAQAGGKDLSKVDEALRQVPQIVAATRRAPQLKG
ncbi:MAG: alanine--tRNA ligase [Chloroflexi bacterium]|nr:alanine--tRNA ligase [Chloroflexota bacterium]